MHGLVARVGLLAPQWYVTLVTFEGVSQLIALEGNVGRLVSLMWYQITRVHCVSRGTRHAWRAFGRVTCETGHMVRARRVLNRCVCGAT